MPNYLLALAVLVSYIVGHAASHASAFLFESLVVRRLLGTPSRLLMGAAAPRRLRWISPGYYQPLDAATRERIVRKAAAAGLPDAQGEALFQLAFARLAKNQIVLGRLDEFRDIYGFARNSAFAFLAVAAAMMTSRLAGGAQSPLGWIITSAGLGIVLFYRYLKFFRQYAYHLLVVFSDDDAEHA